MDPIQNLTDMLVTQFQLSASKTQSTPPPLHKAALLMRRQLAINQMLPAFCHDMNNPLAILAGTSQQMSGLLSSAKLDVEKAKPLFERLDRNTDRLTRLVKGLALLSKDPLREEGRSVECKKIMDEVFSFSEAQYKKHNIELKCTVPDNTPPIYCNPLLWNQTLMILLDFVRTSIQDIKGDLPRAAEFLFPEDQKCSIIQIQYAVPPEAKTAPQPYNACLEFVKEAVQYENGTYSITYVEGTPLLRRIELRLPRVESM